MYDRYKKTSFQGLTVNQQVAGILGDLVRDLKKSDDLFKSYDTAKSLEIAEKSIYKAIGLSSFIEKYADDVMAQPDTTEELKKGLIDLKHHFEVLHKIIISYASSRSEKIFEQIIKNLKMMEDFWKALPASSTPPTDQTSVDQTVTEQALLAQENHQQDQLV